jgi:filamentous hemagglutinin
MLHAAGGALIGALGGGSVFTAVGGGLGACLSSKLAGQLDSLSKGVASETGSDLLGNLAANVAAGVGGTLVGGTSGAATASGVELYNQMNHKNSLVPSSCTATGPCNEAVMTAQMNATGANAQAALNTMSPNFAPVTLSAGVGGTFVLGYGVSVGAGIYLTPGFGNTTFDVGLYATYGTGYGFDPSVGGAVGFNKGGTPDFRGTASNVNTALALGDLGIGDSVTYSNGQATGGSYGIGIKGVPSVAGGTTSVTNMTTCTLGVSNIKNGLAQSICK